ncbi:MAG: aldo/keto reductase [Clostridia bacterium]|nr:aldo/keto reductase [Clostridia bacterium]
MIYRDFQGLNLSMLGLGTMRLPLNDGNDGNIDEETAQKMVDEAINAGVNYFDTAWGYHSGKSEPFMGKALKKYPRDKFYLATKFPGYDVSNFGKVEEIFENQLKRCQVDYFDFYLFHNVCEMNINQYLDDEKYNTYSYLIEQKKNGRIRHLGFSAHGTIETMRKFLEAYGKDMEFCQIQLNYIDWEFQDAKGKIELLKEYNLPIWVMEPLRGGKLAKLDDMYIKRLKEERPEESAPGWAFRFLQSIPGVTMILSGMSDEKQLTENIETFSEEKPLNEKEMKLLINMGDHMTNKTSLPCTACHYCTSHCPKHLDIPYLIDLYNEHCFTVDFAFIAPMALAAMSDDEKPSACVGCRSCEAVCPQQIKISEMMKDFTKRINE